MKKFLSIIMVLAMLLAFSASAEKLGLTRFSTVDMDGSIVTEEIFADYDLTMVNIWATWCGYCVQEMPELSKLKTMLPENVNMITICDDASIETELTRKILTESGANFQTLHTNEDMYRQMLSFVYAFPTTLFVDSEGFLVAQPLTGVPSLENSSEIYYSIIEEILNYLEK